MACRKTMDSKTIFQNSVFIPVQFYKPVFIISPIFEMFANAESANHFSYPVFQTFHCPVIQVIPMIVRNHHIIDIRHIFGFINISSFKWFVDERYRRSHAENRINEKSLSIYLNKVGRMSKPDQYIFITPQLMQIRFDNRNFILRTQVLCFAE